MDKPQDFNKVEAFSHFKTLTPGGHICKIIRVEETTSRAGRDMIVIYLDTDRGDKQPNYFTDLYTNDKRDDKKWSNGGTYRQLILDAEGNTNRGFKTFIEAVEKSNPGFHVQWGENFEKCFLNKLVGVIFGREEYLDNAGISKFAIKPMYFRTIEEIKEGVEVPKDILLNPTADDGYFPEYTPTNDGYQIF